MLFIVETDTAVRVVRAVSANKAAEYGGNPVAVSENGILGVVAEIKKTAPKPASKPAAKKAPAKKKA